jgi:hypothetical protein
MRSPSCLCICVFPLSTNFDEIWYVCHDNWGHLKGVLHKSLSSVYVCICIPLIDGFVNKFCGNQYKQQYTSCRTRHFLCGPCLIKGESVGVCIPLSLLVSAISRIFLCNKELPRLRFLCGPCRMKGKHEISSFQNFLVTIRNDYKRQYVTIRTNTVSVFKRRWTSIRPKRGLQRVHLLFRFREPCVGSNRDSGAHSLDWDISVTACSLSVQKSGIK